MAGKYNPYSVALSLLNETLDAKNIPIVSNIRSANLSESKPIEGFDADVLKSWLVDYQRNSFKTKRTQANYNAYEVLSCPRQMYYLRQGAPYDSSKIAQYPYSTIKACLGEVVEKLLLSMFNQTSGTKWRNGIRMNWDTVTEYGLQYPFNMVIDGISYDEDIILDCKFTDQMDDFHVNQVKLYALAWENIYKKQCVKYVEVIYLNSSINNVTRRRIPIDEEVRKNEFPKIIDRIKTYDYNLRNNILPLPEKHNCNFCVYQPLCKRDENYVDGDGHETLPVNEKKNTDTQIKFTSTEEPKQQNTNNLVVLL